MKTLLRSLIILTVFYPPLAIIGLILMDYQNREWMFNLYGEVGISIVLLYPLGQIYSLVFLSRTDRVPSNRKVLWAAMFFYISVIAIPTFWFLYIRPSWKEESSLLVSRNKH